MKIDLHLHSKFSKRPSQWVLQKLGCPESFTEPRELYRMARERGMDRVTISDHNTISGALEIAHLSDAFISEEATTYFPEDGCKMHVLCWDIDERQHADIQKARENIFDLVDYLNRESIVHGLAHPLYSVNGRLTVAHFEKALLLFKNLEINGSHSASMNDFLRRILESLTRPYLENLADRHGLAPRCHIPWEKNITGGSDDHSSLHMTRMHTVVPGARTLDDFFRGLAENRARVLGQGSSPETLSHNLYSIAYQFYKNRFNLNRDVPRDLLLQFLDRVLAGNVADHGFFNRIYCLWNHRKGLRAEKNGNIQDVFLAEARKLVLDDAGTLAAMKKADGRDLDHLFFEFSTKVSSKLLVHLGDHALDKLSGANLFDIFHSLGAAGALYTVLAPYFVSYSVFSRDRQLARSIYGNVARESTNAKVSSTPSTRVAHFTDTFYEVNGVALTLRQTLEQATRTGRFMRIITCKAGDHSPPYGARNFTPVGTYNLPEYPEQKLFYPPFLEMLRFCYENRFTHVHAATPGPIGLAALGIARILSIPIVGTYHTSLPQYAGVLTNDPAMEEATWKFVLWYYNQMDVIFVSSQSNLDELTEKGIPETKLVLIPRGIDVERFCPAADKKPLPEAFTPERPLSLLYVGRVSREKNLELLVRAAKELARQKFPITLTVVGDGPYLDDMKAALQNFPVTFTGYLDGEELADAYRVSDLFVFPSTTDTFGNVVLEAQASGLPVIVSDQGGPAENMLPGETGLIFPGTDQKALVTAIRDLVENSKRVMEMGANARKYMQGRSFLTAFEKTWSIYPEISQQTSRDPAGGAVRHAQNLYSGYQRLVA